MVPAWQAHAAREDAHLVRIAQHGGMRTDARLVADEAAWTALADDRSPQQLANTAWLPGIVGSAWAMADWHFGYGFPIGGVVATDAEDGVISPGGVGFDINCGVRMLTTGVQASDVPDLSLISQRLARTVPAGAGGRGSNRGVGLATSELEEVLQAGARAASELGHGSGDDLHAIESHGALEVEATDSVSERARARGLAQLGTLGSGNHFLELQQVDSLADEATARRWGVDPGELVIMVHTGSRGLGHQVCSDHVAALESGLTERTDGTWEHRRWGFTLPDRQLACAPLDSAEGTAYLEAMRSAANFAFANRSAITEHVRTVLAAELGGRGAEVDVLYDVAHNIAKLEDHQVDGRSCRCCVHRKGATRALAAGHAELDPRFAGTGQPVLVPGDMGTASWLLAGPSDGPNAAFESSCHGAGRQLSRTAARQQVDVDELRARLATQGIKVHARSARTLSEEAPEAYKDVDRVIAQTAGAGLARPVARLRPLAVVKG